MHMHMQMEFNDAKAEWEEQRFGLEQKLLQVRHTRTQQGGVAWFENMQLVRQWNISEEGQLKVRGCHSLPHVLTLPLDRRVQTWRHILLLLSL